MSPKLFLFSAACLVLTGCIGSETFYTSNDDLELKRIAALTKRASIEMECPEADLKTELLEESYKSQRGRMGKSKHLVKGCEKTQVYDVNCTNEISGWGQVGVGLTMGIVAPSKYNCSVSKEAS